MNQFYPECWISSEDAQRILSGVLTRLGLGDREFSFSPGDLSQILTPYTTRGDLALALYDLCGEIPLETETFAGFLTLWGRALNGAARMADGAYYVPMRSLLSCFPELTALAAAEVFPAPDGDKGYQRSPRLEMEGRALRAVSFLWSNTLYMPIEDAARLLAAEPGLAK